MLNSCDGDGNTSAISKEKKVEQRREKKRQKERGLNERKGVKKTKTTSTGEQQDQDRQPHAEKTVLNPQEDVTDQKLLELVHV